MSKNIAVVSIALGIGAIVALIGYFAFWLSIYVFIFFCAIVAMIIGYFILDCNGGTLIWRVRNEKETL